MELPFNTVYSKDILGNKIETPVADWQTKRAWLNYAYDELVDAGYHISSAYTVVKDPSKVNFSYRDNLWQGSDLLATGIASFGHVSGVHYQNLPEWKEYIAKLLEENQLPLGRACGRPASVAGPRNDPAAQTRISGCPVFPRQVRRRHSRAMVRRLGQSCRGRHGEIDGDRIRLTARRAVACRCAVAAVLRGAVSRSPVYMSERLTFMMGEFEAEFPTDRLYAKNHMWARQTESRPAVRLYGLCRAATTGCVFPGLDD